MSLHFVIAWAALLTTCAYALWRGGGPERTVAAIMMTGAAATRLCLSTVPLRYRYLEWPTLAVDLAVLAAFLAIALRANRRWPIALATLHALSVGAHFVKLVHPDIIRTVYWMMTNLWIYPQLALVAWATRRHRLRLTRLGADPSWSTFSAPSSVPKPRPKRLP